MSDLDHLFDVVWMGLLAGVGLTVIFSLAVAAVVRAGTARRDGRTGAAAAHSALAVVAGICCVVAVALALVTMLHK